MQSEAVSEITDMLGVSEGAASLLLRVCHWDKDALLQRYMDDAEKASPLCAVPPFFPWDAPCAEGWALGGL